MPSSKETRTEFLTVLKNKAGVPWVVLTLCGNKEHSKHQAVFTQGEKISGTVSLHLDTTDVVNSVTLSVRGTVSTGATPGENLVFLDKSTIVWSTETAKQAKPLSFTKLQHEYRWPFNVELPTEVLQQGRPGERERMFPLPGSFYERHTRPRVRYEAIVTVQSRRLLGFKAEKKLQTEFVYLPLIKPNPPLPLRKHAYNDDKPIPNPQLDSEGWLTLDSIDLFGTIFDTRSFNATVTLSLARPLSYTRGTPIPCFITFECDDFQAIEALADPNAIVCRLQRRIQHRRHLIADPHDIGNQDAIQLSEMAAWWPIQEGSNDTKKRLMGEIMLHPELKPSAAMAHFKLEYSVMLFNHDSPYLSFPDSGKGSLLFQQVTIGTALPEPAPRSQAAYYTADVATP